jgi:hypothetical protein
MIPGSLELGPSLTYHYKPNISITTQHQGLVPKISVLWNYSCDLSEQLLSESEIPRRYHITEDNSTPQYFMIITGTALLQLLVNKGMLWDVCVCVCVCVSEMKL